MCARPEDPIAEGFRRQRPLGRMGVLDEHDQATLTVSLLEQSGRSPTGDAAALLEERDGQCSLVVLIKDAHPTKWTLPPEALRYRIFWTSAHRVVLGETAVAPKLVVSWHVEE